jgi:hypothetical protein
MRVEAEPVRSSTHAEGVLCRTLDIEERLQRNPYGMVAGALGIGFVLGGGLFTRLAARILGAGIRVGLMAALPVLEKSIAQSLGGSKSETQKENDP